MSEKFIDEELIRNAWDKFAVVEIASMLDVSVHTVYERANKMGLGANEVNKQRLKQIGKRVGERYGGKNKKEHQFSLCRAITCEMRKTCARFYEKKYGSNIKHLNKDEVNTCYRNKEHMFYVMKKELIKRGYKSKTNKL